MFGNLGVNMDLLAQNNVLDFDGAAYLMDTQPRYMGKPSGQTPPFLMQLEKPDYGNMQLPTQAEFDEFKSLANDDKKDGVKLPAWKKLAFTTLIAACLILGVSKIKSLYTWIKGKLPHKTVN